MGKAENTSPLKPPTIRLRTAAKLLDMHADTLGRLVRAGVFSAVRPHGYGPGRRVFLHTDEVERYGETRSEDAVRDLRIRKRRIKAR